MAIFSVDIASDNASPSGGTAGIFSVAIYLIVGLIEPIFGKVSVSIIYLVIALVFMWLAARKYKLLNAVKNDN